MSFFAKLVILITHWAKWVWLIICPFICRNWTFSPVMVVNDMVHSMKILWENHLFQQKKAKNTTNCYCKLLLKQWWAWLLYKLYSFMQPNYMCRSYYLAYNSKPYGINLCYPHLSGKLNFIAVLLALWADRMSEYYREY